jgi:hypothetical protein
VENYYLNVKGYIIKYMMQSDSDTPEVRRQHSIDNDFTMYECNIHDCFKFNDCNRIYKRPKGKRDVRNCIEYKHFNDGHKVL